MSEQQLDLDRRAYREVPTGPLERPRTLWLGIGFFTVMIGVATWIASMFGDWWAPLLPAFFALWLGVFLCGLFPKFFFGRRDT